MMKTTLSLPTLRELPLIYGLFASLVLLWLWLPGMIQSVNRLSGTIDPSIWLLVLLAIISFLLITSLSWWLLKQSWAALGLPKLFVMVVHFKEMELWQQLGFYWASFALLLLTAGLCLSAVL